jgi:PAS domain S-box-containing protein
LLTILYVDDDPDLLELGSLYLEQIGQFSVDRTPHVPDALSRLSAKHYDAIISDFEMPGMNGIDFLKAVRADYGNIPFILFTGRGREEVAIEALNNGADFYLQKGGDPAPAFTELSHKIQSAVQRRRAEEILRKTIDRLGMAQAIGHIGSWEYDGETGMIWASEEAFKIFGLNIPAGQVPLEAIESCYVDRQNVKKNQLLLIKTEGRYDFEYAIMPADGSPRRYIHSVARLTRNAEGKLVTLSGVIQDVTARRQAEESLRESEEKHRLLLDESSDPIFSFYPNGTYRYVNKAFADGVGKTVDEITGHTIWDIFSPDEADKRFAMVRKVFSTGEQGIIEVRVSRPDGDHYYLTTVTPIKNEAGTVITALCSSKEITDRRLAEEKLRQSEEKFRSLVENANDIVYSFTLDGIFTYVSPTWTGVLGHPLNDIIGHSFEEFIHPEDLPVCRKFLQTALSTGEKQAGVEYRVGHDDGTWRWYTSNASLIRDNSGRPVSFMGIAHDITRLKTTEKALADRLLFQQALINSIPYPVFIKEVTGKFVGCNRAYEQEFGTTREYMIGKTVLDLEYLPVEERKRFQDEDMKVIREAGRRSYELPIVYADGVTHQTIYSVDGFRLADGQPGGLIGMLVDISDRKKMEESLKRANRQLNLMTSITRHDINNKITIVDGYLSLAERKTTDAAITGYLQKIKSAIITIESQIEFTREYQDIGSREPLWQNLDAALPRQHIPSPIALAADVQGIELFADAMLAKVFFNLLDNTLRHGGKTTRISVSYLINPEGMAVIWEDNGTGITAEEKAKIFERGFGKNTGFGLFLVREILALTGISIRETGTAGTGARFEILVPKGMYRTARPGTAGPRSLEP